MVVTIRVQLHTNSRTDTSARAASGREKNGAEVMEAQLCRS